MNHQGFSVVRALQDLSGRRHDPDRQGLVRAAAEPRGVDVDAADAEGAADGGGQVERRGKVIEVPAPQDLGQRMPVDACFAPDGQAVGIDLENPAHAAHVELQPAEGDRFSFRGQAAAAHGHRDPELLGGPHHFGNHLRRPCDQDAPREPVCHAARVSHVQRSRRFQDFNSNSLPGKRGDKLLPSVGLP